MSEVKSSALNTPLTLVRIGVIVVVACWGFSLTSTQAQISSEGETAQAITTQSVLPAGTPIPIKYDLGSKILVAREETIQLTLQVATNITNAYGKVIIPNGSEIIGEIKPTVGGSQFFSQKILLKLDNQVGERSINAISQVVDKIETLVSGINLDALTQDAVLGAIAANLVEAFREHGIRKKIVHSSDLEALAGWLLGRETLELISINPQQDLQLTLQSDLIIKE